MQPTLATIGRASLRLARGAERLVGALFLGLIAFYRLFISPLLGGRCRFLPSCSEYAAECIRHYGALRGGARAVRRLCRCHPFHPGGFDPPVAEPVSSPGIER